MKLPSPSPHLCREGHSSLTLWLQLVQDGLCPTNHATYCDSSHGLGHIADTAEARMGLLGIVIGR